jgi:hypothetical protein
VNRSLAAANAIRAGNSRRRAVSRIMAERPIGCECAVRVGAAY